MGRFFGPAALRWRNILPSTEPMDYGTCSSLRQVIVLTSLRDSPCPNDQRRPWTLSAQVTPFCLTTLLFRNYAQRQQATTLCIKLKDLWNQINAELMLTIPKLFSAKVENWTCFLNTRFRVNECGIIFLYTMIEIVRWWTRYNLKIDSLELVSDGIQIISKFWGCITFLGQRGLVFHQKRIRSIEMRLVLDFYWFFFFFFKLKKFKK